MSTENTPKLIKQRIYEKLLTVSKLKEVIIDDFTKQVHQLDISEYPAALVTAPQLQTAERLDNRTNIREYLFTVPVIIKPADLSTGYEVEELMDELFDAFDNDYTLNGAADGGITPLISPVEPLPSANGDYATFDLLINARHTRTLTY